MDIELRWFRHSRSFSYVLQYRVHPGGEWSWDKWQDVPYIREEEDYPSGG